MASSIDLNQQTPEQGGGGRGEVVTGGQLGQGGWHDLHEAPTPIGGSGVNETAVDQDLEAAVTPAGPRQRTHRLQALEPAPQRAPTGGPEAEIAGQVGEGEGGDHPTAVVSCEQEVLEDRAVIETKAVVLDEAGQLAGHDLDEPSKRGSRNIVGGRTRR